MQSFLIISRDLDLAKEYYLNFCKSEKIDKFDINVFESEKTFGIGLVRELQQKIFLKPLKSEQKAVVIVAFEGITIEAQNALLKILEEPPANTIIILVVKSEEEILPTILSRCTVINLNKEDLKLSEEEITKYDKLIATLSEKGIGERLKFAESLSKDKKTALSTLEKMILSLRNKIKEDHANSKQYLQQLKTVQQFYNDIKNTNVNLRLALENLFLSLGN